MNSDTAIQMIFLMKTKYGSALKTSIVKDIEMKEKFMDSKVTINIHGTNSRLIVIAIGERRKGSCFAVNEMVENHRRSKFKSQCLRSAI